MFLSLVTKNKELKDPDELCCRDLFDLKDSVHYVPESLVSQKALTVTVRAQKTMFKH